MPLRVSQVHCKSQGQTHVLQGEQCSEERNSLVFKLRLNLDSDTQNKPDRKTKTRAPDAPVLTPQLQIQPDRPEARSQTPHKMAEARREKPPRHDYSSSGQTGVSYEQRYHQEEVSQSPSDQGDWIRSKAQGHGQKTQIWGQTSAQRTQLQTQARFPEPQPPWSNQPATQYPRQENESSWRKQTTQSYSPLHHQHREDSKSNWDSPSKGQNEDNNFTERPLWQQQQTGKRPVSQDPYLEGKQYHVQGQDTQPPSSNKSGDRSTKWDESVYENLPPVAPPRATAGYEAGSQIREASPQSRSSVGRAASPTHRAQVRPRSPVDWTQIQNPTPSNLIHFSGPRNVPQTWDTTPDRTQGARKNQNPPSNNLTEKQQKAQPQDTTTTGRTQILKNAQQVETAHKKMQSSPGSARGHMVKAQSQDQRNQPVLRQTQHGPEENKATMQKTPSQENRTGTSFPLQKGASQDQGFRSVVQRRASEASTGESQARCPFVLLTKNVLKMNCQTK